MALHPKSIDLVLDRVYRLLAALGNPERDLPPVVHVAGTNGKGSTVAFLRAMAEAAGLTVHVYTSPHLIHFNERIRIAGHLIADQDLAAILNECENANQGLPITFFEITTVAAFLAFSKTPADLVILETGLGGRLDATNVIKTPRLTCITPVSMDHQHFLGDDILTIMNEKMGILKPGVPCVAARQDDVRLSWALRTMAHKIDARLIVAEQNLPEDMPKPALPGHHQIQNAAVAVACAQALAPDYNISNQAIRQGLKRVAWPGRLQHIQDAPWLDVLGKNWELWVDGGHNVGAAKALADHFETWKDQDIWVIFGGLNQRDPVEFLKPLACHIKGLYAVKIPDEDNAMTSEQGQNAAASLGIVAKSAPSVMTAVQDLVSSQDTLQNGTLRQKGRILVCGSLYLVGHVLAQKIHTQTTRS